MKRFIALTVALYHATLAAFGLMPTPCGNANCKCVDVSQWVGKNADRLAIHVPLRSGRHQYADAVADYISGRARAGKGGR